MCLHVCPIIVHLGDLLIGEDNSAAVLNPEILKGV